MMTVEQIRKSDIAVHVLDPRWVGLCRELKSQLADCRFRYFLQLADLLEHNRTRAASFNLVEVEDATAAAPWIWRLSRCPGQHRTVCLCLVENRDREPILREAGAAACVYSAAALPRIAGWIRRHSQFLPPWQMPLKTAIIERLPWDLTESPD